MSEVAWLWIIAVEGLVAGLAIGLFIGTIHGECQSQRYERRWQQNKCDTCLAWQYYNEVMKMEWNKAIDVQKKRMREACNDQ